MNNEYENVMVPELIKDAVRTALQGNEPARQRLETIRSYINQALTTVEQNASLGLYRPKRKDSSKAFRPRKATPSTTR